MAIPVRCVQVVTWHPSPHCLLGSLLACGAVRAGVAALRNLHQVRMDARAQARVTSGRSAWRLVARGAVCVAAPTLNLGGPAIAL